MPASLLVSIMAVLVLYGLRTQALTDLHFYCYCLVTAAGRGRAGWWIRDSVGEIITEDCVKAKQSSGRTFNSRKFYNRLVLVRPYVRVFSLKLI